MKYKIHFSETEVKQIALALVALSFSFQLIIFRKEIFVEGLLTNMPAMASFFLQSLIIVGFAFVLHELGHKFVAQKKGLWAEFRAWPAGLLLAVAMALLSRGGFVFAAPGAVMIAPARQTKRGFVLKVLKKQDVGLIGIIGAAINIVLAVIFSLLALVFAAKIFGIGAQVNAWLAIFNLIPFNPLDGAKVFYWSKAIWLGTFALAIFIFALTLFV